VQASTIVIDEFNKGKGEPHTPVGFVDHDIECNVFCR
jgi:hypothetical protein